MDINLLKSKIKSKDNEAMLELANIYLNDNDKKNFNFKEGFSLLEESSKYGNIDALFYLGQIYLSDKYELKNIKTALEYFENSARKGGDKANNILGKIYLSGSIVKKDYFKSSDYLRKSANKNNTESQYLMGYLYEGDFLGENPDYNESFRFYKKAADNSHTESQYRVGKYYVDGIDGFLNPDIEKGIEYLRLSSEKNNIKSMNLLSAIYIKEAFKLLKKSSKEDSDAEHVLNLISNIKTDILR